MITFLQTYDDRKKELDKFLYFMEFLEQQEFMDNDGISNFDTFFKIDEKHNITYQSLINILKSSFSIMLYNIIEFTIANLVDSIYDEIRSKGLSYLEVNESIRDLWRKTFFKSIKDDPNASFNTFLNANKRIIDLIIERQLLAISSNNSLPAGNLDLREIKKVMKQHGLVVTKNKQNFRPDIFENIKQRRNDLAHGSVSFEDASREDTLKDIRNNEEIVIGLLDELIKQVKVYIDAGKYRIAK